MAICEECRQIFEPFYKDHPESYCNPCNDKKWAEWETEESGNLSLIKELQQQGHSHHCACRQAWGDGECECNLYRHGYNPYDWIRSIFLNHLKDYRYMWE